MIKIIGLVLFIIYITNISFVVTIDNNNPYYLLYNEYHNEYNQYLKYIHIRSLSINETYLFSEINQCNAKNFEYCGEELVSEINRNNSLLWEQTLNTSHEYTYKSRFITNLKEQLFYKFNIDCQYDIVYDPIAALWKRNISSDNEIKYLYILPITFQIIQSNCKSISEAKSIASGNVNDFDLYKGGSSFDITIENESYFTTCTMQDLFDTRYNVSCFIPFHQNNLNILSTNLVHICSNITIILDYEHYNAFDDIRLTPLKLRHYLTKSKMMCYNILNLLSHAQILDINKLELSKQYYRYWKNIESYSLGYYQKNLNNNYQWSNNNRLFLNKKQLKDCIYTYGKILLIGSSHMRFNFDHLVYSYVNQDILGKLEKYHGKHIVYSKFEHRDVRFINNIAEYLSSDLIKEICERQENINIIVMVGTWDTYFWSPRNFIRNPLYGDSLIKSLLYLKQSQCNRYIRIIWVTTVPQVPSIISWSNNHAINAAMQWLIDKIIDIDYGDNLVIVDAFRMILPTVSGERDDNVCKNHYLCHKEFQDQILQTVAGKLILSTILRATCDIKISAVEENNSNLVAYKNGDYPSETLVSSNTIKLTATNSSVYMFWNGLKRLIPDLSTFECMKLDKESIIILNSSELSNIPFDMPLPSWKDKTLIRTLYSKIYVIENCTKQLVSDLYELSRDYLGNNLPSNLATINLIEQYDLKNIPIGKDLIKWNGTELGKIYNNKIVRVYNEKDLYLIQNEKKRNIVDMNVVSFYHLNISQTKVLSWVQLNSIPSDLPLLIPQDDNNNNKYRKEKSSYSIKNQKMNQNKLQPLKYRSSQLDKRPLQHSSRHKNKIKTFISI